MPERKRLKVMGFLARGRPKQVSVVMEQAMRLFQHCGMPAEDIDFINCDRSVMHG